MTVELDPAALEVARLNPWSRRLFDHPRIRVEQGDVAEYLESQPSGSFSAVLHDPPTIQFAGDLYSLEFYRLLKRVLSKAGRLFHYTGDPASAQGAKVTAGVVRRLGDVGFRRIERHAAAFGVTASA